VPARRAGLLAGNPPFRGWGAPGEDQAQCMVRRASRERSAPVPFPKTLTVPVLEGELVRLEPLDHRHAADLAVAAKENRSSYHFTWVPTAAQVGDYIDAQLARRAAGTLAPYAQLAKATGRTVGATAYWDPRLWPDRDELCAVEVGFTWLAASAQGTTTALMSPGPRSGISCQAIRNRLACSGYPVRSGTTLVPATA
jgi:hypothetical protein